MLYSRLPRSSQLPWMVIFAVLLPTRYFACASTSGLYSSLTLYWSKSKYTLRLDNTLRGSLSGFPAPVAVPLTPAPVAPVVAAPLSVGDGVRSSTGTPVSVLGVVWQPPSNPSRPTAVRRIKVELAVLIRFIVVSPVFDVISAADPTRVRAHRWIRR